MKARKCGSYTRGKERYADNPLHNGVYYLSPLSHSMLTQRYSLNILVSSNDAMRARLPANLLSFVAWAVASLRNSSIFAKISSILSLIFSILKVSEDRTPTKELYPTTRVSQHEVENITNILTKFNNMVRLTRRSNLDSQRSVSHDMRAHILQLLHTKRTNQ